MKKVKLLNKLLLIPSCAMISTGITTLTSCSKNVPQITKDIIKEFEGVCTIPRPCDDGKHWEYLHGAQLKGIRDYIISKAKAVGIPDADIHTEENYYNLWIDIDGNDPELTEPVILQGHMDMVVDGIGSWEGKTTTPIVPEIDWKHNIIHSKDYKTSLGADDGIALALIINLMNHKEIKHGPIRAVFTTEEDAGMFGADEISKNHPEVFQTYKHKPIKYLINLDGEEDGMLLYGGFASAMYSFTTYEGINNSHKGDLTNVFSLNIDGMLGGHSGVDIQRHRGNANKMLMNFLYDVISSNQDNEVQLVKLWHPRETSSGLIEDVAYTANQIVANGQVIFKTNLDKNTLTNYLNTKIQDWKTKYSGENWDKVKIELKEATILPEDQNKCFSENYSQKIITFIGKEINNDWSKEVQDCLHYGEFPKINNEQWAWASTNISPLDIKYDSRGYMYVDITTQCRCEKNDTLNTLKWYYDNIERQHIFHGRLITEYPAWEGTPEGEMLQICKKGYESIGVTPKIDIIAGGLEVAYWSKANPNLSIACIGPQNNDCHTTRETLFIDTITHCQSVLEYALQQMKTK